MILDILVFALGFLVAGLLALSALPAVWRRALRLTEERLSRLVPLSPDEIAAERDHLRAAHAVALRRTEQKLERAEADGAALRVAAARRENRILALDDEAVRAQVRIAGLEAASAALQREVNGLWAESGAEAIALQGLSQLAEARLGAIAGLQADRAALAAERDDLAQQVDRSRSSVAGLETRLVGAETRVEDLRRELDLTRRAAAAEREAAPRAEDGRPPDDRTHEIEALKTELAFMAEQAASAERRATEASKACEALRAERSDGGVGGDDGEARLRAAISALADDVLRLRRPTTAA